MTGYMSSLYLYIDRDLSDARSTLLPLNPSNTDFDRFLASGFALSHASSTTQ